MVILSKLNAWSFFKTSVFDKAALDLTFWLKAEGEQSALRKKTQITEDCDPQTQEETQKEQTQEEIIQEPLVDTIRFGGVFFI